MQYFVPQSQVPGPPAGVGPGPGVQGLLVRGRIDADALIAPIRRAVLDGRTDLPFVEVQPYAELLQQQMRPWRLGTALLTLFGVLALGVAASAGLLSLSFWKKVAKAPMASPSTSICMPMIFL